MLLHSFITAVAQTAGRLQKRQPALLEQSQIVCFARSKGRRQQAFVAFPDNHLRFARVPLLFAAVVTPLFFWGLSTGVSVASTTITCHSNSGSPNAFLPGKAKRPEPNRAASILRIVRCTVGSETSEVKARGQSDGSKRCAKANDTHANTSGSATVSLPNSTCRAGQKREFALARLAPSARTPVA